jgi:hypothetical protein
MTPINYCINDDCKNIATSNIIENILTRCDLHKIDDNIYKKTLDYIERFRAVHIDKYNYYKTLYTNYRSKIIITCKIHGDFLTRTDIHLAGHNCKKCTDNSHNRNNTTEQFIQVATKKHGTKFDYSKVVYVRHDIPVTIICPTHGEFTQRPEQHIAKTGCTKCGYEKGATNNKLTTDEFIKRSIHIHGNIYDYSKVNYTGWDNNVTIICKIHTQFKQRAGNHLQGRGCNKCQIKKSHIQNSLCNKSNTDDFIKKANQIHYNKYDYSIVEYINNAIKINIICRTHGIFEQTPASHLSGSGCPKCAIEKVHNEQKKSQEEYINQCKKIHNDKYDYSKLIYNTCKDNVIIICKKHGDFIQNASVHLKGCGCIKCRDEEMSINRRFSLKTVIENAQNIHGDKYDYTLITNYINNTTPLEIICHEKYKDGTEHGIFKQSYQCHVQMKTGCPRCAINGFSKSQIEWLEFIMTNIQINISNIKNDKEHRILGSFKLADGYCKKINTIFEFDGCYFHGCPKCYTNRDLVNTRCKKTFQQLYDNTIAKYNFCKEKGYNIITIWECDWKIIKKNRDKANEYIQSLKKILNISEIKE